MASLKLVLELVTPLLMNGADRPEIRSSSFRGVFRYWLRTIMGGVFGSKRDKLFELESFYWGSTDVGSALRLRVSHSLNSASNYFVLPPMVYYRIRREKVPFSHKGFEQVNLKSDSLELTIDTHSLRKAESIFTPLFFSSLLLSFYLSGFGKRSRRGGGNLQVIKMESDFSLDSTIQDLFLFRAECGEDLISFFDKKLIPYVNAAQTALGDLVPDRQEYPIWTPEHVKIRLGGNSFVDTGAKDTPKQPTKGYRLALQEPWDISGNLDLHRMEDAWGNGNPRRASAVHIGVHKGKGGKYYPVVAMFRSRSKDKQWGRLEEFDKALQNKGYHRPSFCKGVWK